MDFNQLQQAAMKYKQRMNPSFRDSVAKLRQKVYGDNPQYGGAGATADEQRILQDIYGAPAKEAPQVSPGSQDRGFFGTTDLSSMTPSSGGDAFTLEKESVTMASPRMVPHPPPPNSRVRPRTQPSAPQTTAGRIMAMGGNVDKSSVPTSERLFRLMGIAPDPLKDELSASFPTSIGGPIASGPVSPMKVEIAPNHENSSSETESGFSTPEGFGFGISGARKWGQNPQEDEEERKQREMRSAALLHMGI